MPSLHVVDMSSWFKVLTPIVAGGLALGGLFVKADNNTKEIEKVREESQYIRVIQNDVGHIKEDVKEFKSDFKDFKEELAEALRRK